MSHLFVDLDDHIPGAIDSRGADPWPAVLADSAAVESAPVVGWHYPYSDIEVPVVFVRGQLVGRPLKDGPPHYLPSCFAARAPGGVSSDEHYRTGERLVAVHMFGFGWRLARVQLT